MSSVFPDQQMPEAARRLEALLGTWTVSGSITTGHESAQISGTWEFRSAANRHGVHMAGHTAIDGMGVLEEEELIGYDPEQKKLHLFSLNKLAVRDHVGDWTGERTLEVVYSGDHAGKHCREVIALSFHDDRIDATVLESLDGELVTETTLRILREA